jgi:hypothetical protein
MQGDNVAVIDSGGEPHVLIVKDGSITRLTDTVGWIHADKINMSDFLRPSILSEEFTILQLPSCLMGICFDYYIPKLCFPFK